MNEPSRLRHGAGPARELLRGAGLSVPHASRRRALAFTAAATNLAAGGTALAAGSMSLVKSVALCVSLGVVGGGVASLGVSSAITRWEQPSEAAPARAAASARPAPSPTVLAAEPVVAEPVVAEPAAPATVEVSPPPPKELAPVRSAPPLTTSSAPAARPASLFDEQRVIESARAAIARGDAGGGLRLLDDYSRTFPTGQFQPEALALRVEALSHGDRRRAKALAEVFARKYPQHPLLPRVQASVGGP